MWPGIGFDDFDYKSALNEGKINTYNPLRFEVSRSYCTERGCHLNWNNNKK